MKSKLLILIPVGSIFGVSLSHHDPLQLFVNFIVGGVVPGVNISLGFLPTLAVILFLLWLIKRWISDLHFQMIRRTALEMNAERTKQELHTTQTERSERRRSIVAARGLETGTPQL